MNTRCGVPTDTPASRPCASMMLPLRSFDWLMIGDDAARPRCVAASKQTVSNAPRMIAAVTGSTVAEAASGARLAARCLFNSKDIDAIRCHDTAASVPTRPQPAHINAVKVSKLAESPTAHTSTLNTAATQYAEKHKTQQTPPAC